jgi:hypothetical protein
VQAPIGDARTGRGPGAPFHAPLSSDDPELTNEVPVDKLTGMRTSDEGLRGAAREIQGMVDAFDEAGTTDPHVRAVFDKARRPPTSARIENVRPPMSPSVRAIDPSSGERRAPDERPPSAYFDLASVERSYAGAVDPDLIVDALKRARGNVSGAARYLGKPRALVLRWVREFGLEPTDYRDG